MIRWMQVPYALVNSPKKRSGKIHHAINGQINYFDWAIFNSKLLVYQRVMIIRYNIYKQYEYATIR
jgi:hypothetical protein